MEGSTRKYVDNVFNEICINEGILPKYIYIYICVCVCIYIYIYIYTHTFPSMNLALV